MDKVDSGCLGFVIGMITIGIVILLCAGNPVKDAVQDGYLIYRNKTYTVVLYDTLEKPDKVE